MLFRDHCPETKAIDFVFHVSQETVFAEDESAGLGAEGGLGAGEAASTTGHRGGRPADRRGGGGRGRGEYHMSGVRVWSVSQEEVRVWSVSQEEVRAR